MLLTGLGQGPCAQAPNEPEPHLRRSDGYDILPGRDLISGIGTDGNANTTPTHRHTQMGGPPLRLRGTRDYGGLGVPARSRGWIPVAPTRPSELRYRHGRCR